MIEVDRKMMLRTATMDESGSWWATFSYLIHHNGGWQYCQKVERIA